MSTNSHELRVFGNLADHVSAHVLEVPADATVAQVRTLLESHYPGLREVTYRIAVDHLMADDHQVLHASQVIALLPPFSGG